MDVNPIIEQKIKLKKKFSLIKDIVLITVAVLFIITGYIYALDQNNFVGESYRNFRYGLFSSALVLSGTILIIAVYCKDRKKNSNKFYLKPKKKEIKK